MLTAKAKENQKRKPNSVPQISAEQKIETREELAKLAGVSRDTVSKCPPWTVTKEPAPVGAPTTKEPLSGDRGSKTSEKPNE